MKTDPVIEEAKLLVSTFTLMGRLPTAVTIAQVVARLEAAEQACAWVERIIAPLPESLQPYAGVIGAEDARVLGDFVMAWRALVPRDAGGTR